MNVPGPSTTFTVFARASWPQGPFAPPSVASALGGHVARQASLEPEQPHDVRAQHELLQVALHEHLDRLFAEAASRSAGWRGSRELELETNVLVAAVGLQPQRERCASEPEHERDGEHERAPAERRRRRERRRSGAAAHSIPSGPADCAGEELAHERVLGCEQLFSGAGFDDPPLPQHRDVLGHAPRAHDVVRDHHVAAAVLGVDFLDQLAQQRRAHRVKAGVGLVEQDDVGFEHERAREAGALAHAAGELVGHLLRSPCRARPRAAAG